VPGEQFQLPDGSTITVTRIYDSLKDLRYVVSGADGNQEVVTKSHVPFGELAAMLEENGVDPPPDPLAPEPPKPTEVGGDSSIEDRPIITRTIRLEKGRIAEVMSDGLVKVRVPHVEAGSDDSFQAG